MKVVFRNDWAYLGKAYLAIIACLVLIFLSSGSFSAASAAMVGGSTMLIMSLFNLDHRSKFQDYLRALPVSKYALLHARYMEMLVNFGVLILLSKCLVGEETSQFMYYLFYFGSISFFLPYGCKQHCQIAFFFLFLLAPMFVFFPLLFGVRYFGLKEWENVLRISLGGIGVLCFFLSYLWGRKVVENCGE